MGANVWFAGGGSKLKMVAFELIPTRTLTIGRASDTSSLSDKPYVPTIVTWGTLISMRFCVARVSLVLVGSPWRQGVVGMVAQIVGSSSCWNTAPNDLRLTLSALSK